MLIFCVCCWDEKIYDGWYNVSIFVLKSKLDFCYVQIHVYTSMARRRYRYRTTYCAHLINKMWSLMGFQCHNWVSQNFKKERNVKFFVDLFRQNCCRLLSSCGSYCFEKQTELLMNMYQPLHIDGGPHISFLDHMMEQSFELLQLSEKWYFSNSKWPNQ